METTKAPPLPVRSLRDLLEAPLSSDAKVVAMFLAAHGPLARDEIGKALRMRPYEVEGCCRDLSRPQVRWMTTTYDSGRLDLLDDCPVRRIFTRKKESPKNEE